MNSPHQRYNPLTGEWVLVSPHRTQRPWLGQVEKKPPENLPAYDPDCYLCPGNPRAGGKSNPDYHGTFVFDNDFPSLLTPGKSAEVQNLHTGFPPSRWNLEQATAAATPFLAAPVYGICRVVCFSPRHDLTLPEMPPDEIEAVVRTWTDQTRQLGELPFIHYVQVFENKGSMMGASNPHPHSQVWATSIVPNEPAKEIVHLNAYQAEHKTCLLCQTLSAETAAGERLVCANQHFSAIVPFWAVWPFEVMIIAHRHAGSLTDLTPAETSALADILQRITTRYDNLFEVSFPYSMGFHQSPTDGQAHPECHLHLHFYPPLLRSATVRKFMVGFEMLGMPQRDLTPESAAERLREVGEVHYKARTP